MLRTIAILMLGFVIGMAAARGGEDAANLPHAEAIRLVLAKRAAQLRAVDAPERWWFDTQRRTWSVTRPSAPGVIDTTHLFTVFYEIGGKQVARWNVNTPSGVVAGAEDIVVE